MCTLRSLLVYINHTTLQQLAADKAELESQIASLQASIATYKGEYADAIREIESVKVSRC
jgi:prefoldin subunit 5